MALINWESSFSVNIEEIDNQHQKLIGYINDLNDAMKVGKGKEIILPILNQLISYTDSHFKFEEQYFDKFGYANASEHKTHHANLVKQVIAFRDDFQNGKLGLTVELLNFLVTWLKNHILVEDKKYTSCLNSNGIK